MRITISNNQILELLELARQGRAQQANISQKTEIESQDRKDNKSKESQNNNQTATKVNLEPEDIEDQAEIAQLQSQNQNQDDITSTDLTLRPCAKGELYDIGPYVGTAGESRVSHESCDAPSPSRVQSTIVEGGVEGDPVTREIEQGIDIRKSTGRLDDDDHRGAITIKSALKTEGLTTRAPLAAELTVDDYNALDDNDYSQEELMEELMEEPRVGSVDRQKENVEDLSSDFITSGPDLGHGQMHDFDDIHALPDEINSITLNGANRNGNCPHDPGGDLDSDLAESSWGHDPHINPWDSLDKSGGLGCGSVTVWMLDKFKEEEQTFLSTSPDSSDFEELPPDVPHLVEFLPPSPQEEQLLIADSVLPASKEEQPGITSHDFKSMERTENGA